MKRVLKLPAKRAIGLCKGVRMAGHSFVSPLAHIRGRWRVTIADEARIVRTAQVKVRPGGSVTVGTGSTIGVGVVVDAGQGDVRIGDGCQLVNYCLVYGMGDVTLGNRVLVGNHSLISSVDHTYEGRASVARQPVRYAPVVIEDDVWIGAHCVILAGVRIGQGAIVASHSLVKDDVPSFAVVGGTPARVLRMRSEA